MHISIQNKEVVYSSAKKRWWNMLPTRYQLEQSARSLGLCRDCLRNTRDVPPFRRHRKWPKITRAWCPRPNCTWPGWWFKKTGSFQQGLRAETWRLPIFKKNLKYQKKNKNNLPIFCGQTVNWENVWSDSSSWLTFPIWLSINWCKLKASLWWRSKLAPTTEKVDPLLDINRVITHL